MDLAKIRKKAKSGTAARTDAPAEQAALPDAPVPEPVEPPCKIVPEPVEDPPPPPPETSDLPVASEAPAATDAGAVAQGSPASGEDSAATGEKLLIFDLGAEKYAIPIHDIAQIIDMPPATMVPNAPDFLVGIFSLRGRIVSIIDAARRLGLGQGTAPTPKVVILDMGADHFGLLVDSIDQVVDVNLAALEPPPDGFKPVAQEFVEGVFHRKDRAVAFLNLPMFLAFEV